MRTWINIAAFVCGCLVGFSYQIAKQKTRVPATPHPPVADGQGRVVT